MRAHEQGCYGILQKGLPQSIVQQMEGPGHRPGAPHAPERAPLPQDLLASITAMAAIGQYRINLPFTFYPPVRVSWSGSAILMFSWADRSKGQKCQSNRFHIYICLMLVNAI